MESIKDVSGRWYEWERKFVNTASQPIVRKEFLK